MAYEVIIIEMTRPRCGDGSSIGGKRITTQVLNVGTRSAKMNAQTEFVVIQSNVSAFWVKQGDSAVNAVAAADGNELVYADTLSQPFIISPGQDYFDTAAVA